MLRKKEGLEGQGESGMALGRINYIMLLGGCALILVGFALMAGGRAEEAGEFNPAIFNFRRITLAPVVIVLGFALDIVGVLYRRRVK